MADLLPVDPDRGDLPTAAPAGFPSPPPTAPSPESAASLGNSPLQLATECYNTASAPATAEATQLPDDMSVTVPLEREMRALLVQYEPICAASCRTGSHQRIEMARLQSATNRYNGIDVPRCSRPEGPSIRQRPS